MRLGRLVPIVVSVLVVSAGLPFVARGEAPAQRGPTATPTRMRGLPSATPTRPVPVPTQTPTRTPTPTPSRTATKPPMVVLPLFTATFTASRVPTSSATTAPYFEPNVDTFAGNEGSELVDGTPIDTVEGLFDGSEFTREPPGLGLGLPAAEGPPPTQAFPIPPWLLMVPGAGLLGGAFLGFKLLGGLHPAAETYGAEVVSIPIEPIEPMGPGPEDGSVRLSELPSYDDHTKKRP